MATRSEGKVPITTSTKRAVQLTHHAMYEINVQIFLFICPSVQHLLYVLITFLSQILSMITHDVMTFEVTSHRLSFRRSSVSERKSHKHSRPDQVPLTQADLCHRIHRRVPPSGPRRRDRLLSGPLREALRHSPLHQQRDDHHLHLHG